MNQALKVFPVASLTLELSTAVLVQRCLHANRIVELSKRVCLLVSATAESAMRGAPFTRNHPHLTKHPISSTSLGINGSGQKKAAFPGTRRACGGDSGTVSTLALQQGGSGFTAFEPEWACSPPLLLGFCRILVSKNWKSRFSGGPQIVVMLRLSAELSGPERSSTQSIFS